MCVEVPVLAFGAMLRVCVVSCLALGVYCQGPDVALTREQLQPLTQFRQQHRKTLDGRLCSAAFVQERKAYTDCSTAPSPTGESGRPWCYVESQVVDVESSAATWGFCAPVIDYAAARAVAHDALIAKVANIRLDVTKLQKAQRAAEAALGMYHRKCAQ